MSGESVCRLVECVFRVVHYPLESGDRVLLFTDGIGDNLTLEELLAITQDSEDAEDAITRVSNVIRARMLNIDDLIDKVEMRGGRSEIVTEYEDGYRSEPKRDNATMVIVDIK